MSRVVHTNIWSAYGYARKAGYEGTEEEFEQGLKKSAEAAENAEESASTASEAAAEANAARDAAAQSAESASTSEGNALEYANSAAQVLRDAQAVAQTVNAKANEAAGSASRAENYAQTATTKASEATTAAGTATAAATSASGSAQEADASATAAAASETNAAASASSASTSAGSASESADAAAASADEAKAVQESIPEDYSQLSADVTDLKSQFNKLSLVYFNLFDKNDVVSGYINNNGNINPSDSYRTSNLIDISNYDTLSFSYTNFGGWFDEEGAFISPLNTTEMNSLAADKSITVPANAKYIRVSAETTNLNKVQVGEFADRNNYIPHKLYGLQNLRLDSSQIEGTDYLRKELGLECINLFDKNNVVSGYLNSAGNILPSDSYRTSQPIDITNFNILSFSYTNFGGWYNDEGFIAPLNSTGMNTLSTDKSVDVPSGAKYLRITVETTNLDKAQVGEFADRNNYIPHGLMYLKKIFTPDDKILEITVDKNGNGDYTSITEALYNNISKEAEITVIPGTYDLIEEYKTFFGETTFVNMSTSTNLNGFQNGVVLRNKKIHFMPGSVVVCDWTASGHDDSNYSNFSPFRVDYNVEVDGLYLRCNGTYYGIHDDYGITTPYEVKYKNCSIIGSNLRNKNCIGGGCKAFSRHILENCYFANGESAVSDPILACCVRYHNTNAEGAVPEVYVSNCYFETNFNACYYGQQTSKMRVYVNNCKAPNGINKVRESSTMNIDNVDLFKWNNDET